MGWVENGSKDGVYWYSIRHYCDYGRVDRTSISASTSVGRDLGFSVGIGASVTGMLVSVMLG